MEIISLNRPHRYTQAPKSYTVTPLRIEGEWVYFRRNGWLGKIVTFLSFLLRDRNRDKMDKEVFRMCWKPDLKVVHLDQTGLDAYLYAFTWVN